MSIGATGQVGRKKEGERLVGMLIGTRHLAPPAGRCSSSLAAYQVLTGQ